MIQRLPQFLLRSRSIRLLTTNSSLPFTAVVETQLFAVGLKYSLLLFTLLSPDHVSPRVLMSTCNPVPLPLASPSLGLWPDLPFILLNPGRHEYYRVNYGPMWSTIVNSLETPNGSAAAIIPATDYAGLLDDAFFLAQHAQPQVTGATFMRLSEALAHRKSGQEV